MKPPLKLIVIYLLMLAPATIGASRPVSLHPQNGHYFLFRGKPTILITSGEHYGAVLNLDFDYTKYLDTLAKDGLNLTRTFSGAYAEPYGAFNIQSNTLAPLSGRFICPWARSETPRYNGGGSKFDLNRWDTDYFKRLKDFVGYASRKGIVVEMNLFCPMYENSMWALSPQNASNNINGVGNTARTNVYTLDKSDGLLGVQEAMTLKIVTELNAFDNVYYEICNEPYFGGVTIEWQRHIADIITATEKTLPRKHLISQNIANGKARIENPHPAVSIFNFHYARPPETVPMNYSLGKVIGDNETGFKGTNDSWYRLEAWEFILAGGGLYNNLDYSFVAGFEDGTFKYHARQPGGGTSELRHQLKILKDFMNRFQFVRMHPDDSVIKGGWPAKGRVHCLTEPGKQYAVHIFGGERTDLSMDLPAGKYRTEWVNTMTGKTDKQEDLRSNGTTVTLHSPIYQDEIAVCILRR